MSTPRVDLTRSPHTFPDMLGAGSSAVRTQTELAAALAAGGNVVVDSSVTIALTTQMTITKPTRLIGGKFTRSAGVAFRITSSDVEFAGVTITGGGTSSYDATQKLIHAVGASGNRLTGLNIHDCILRNSRRDNIWIEWCDGAQIHGNTIRSYLYSAVMVISGLRCRVANNDVSDGILATFAGQVDVYGIAFTDLDNTLAARSVDCSAIGNIVSLVDWEGIDTHGGDSITIANNIITGCPRAVALVGGNTSRLTQPQRCLVIGNRIDGTGMRRPAREGIIVGGMAGKLADATITGNVIDNNGTPILLDNWDRTKTYVGGNSDPLIPWTDLDLTGDVGGHASLPPQFMVDGNTVHIRGAVYRTSSASISGTIAIPVATLPIAARPFLLTWFSAVKAAVGNGTGGLGEWWIEPDGVLRLGYLSNYTNTNVAWPLQGSYRVP